MGEVHLFSLAFSAIFILYSDHLGLLYFLGKKQTMPIRAVRRLHKLVWIGLIGLIISGVFLTLPAWDFYINDTIFQIKMGFVGVLVLNGLFIGALLQTATRTPFAKIPPHKKMLLLLSGAASATSWIGAALIGFLWL